METKAITNNFGQGMTNIPSDAICPDDTTSAEYNLIFRDGEHRPIQSPVNLFDGQNEESRHDMRLLYIHSYNDVKRCIFHNENNDYLYWTFKDDIDTISPLLESFKISVKDINGITSIGNTLIISLTTEGHKSLHYFLWKPEDNNYKFIGTKLPSPNFDFLLHRSLETGETDFIKTDLDVNNNFDFNYIGGNNQTWEIKPKDGKEEDMKAFLIGAYSKLKVEAAQKNKFCLPFFIRYALKLYDGTYTNISIPILMIPSMFRNVGFSNNEGKLQCIIYPCKLLFKQTINLTDWKDIINGVSIFITKPVENNDTQVVEENTIKPDGISTDELPNKSSHDYLYGFNSERPYSGYVTYTGYNCTTSFRSLTKEQMQMALENESVFYKLCDIELDSMSLYSTIDRYMRPHDLENITTAEQLDHDDYYSNCDIFSKTMFMYNKRLHLANPNRGFYKGASLFSPVTLNSSGVGIKLNHTSFVYIKTQDGERIVKKEFATKDYLGLYFYYPDPRAYKAVIFITQGGITTKRYELELKSHPLLNGAYYINYDSSTTTADVITSMPTENTEPEQLQNEVWVSEVNNPFVFNASGVNTVGNGSIIGVVSNTTALSQGQFGQFPLICFTTDGIYALQTSETGIYSAAHPISREVCNNPKSIVATDHLVFFSSEKGLMMINGSQVTCVSQNLSGKTFYQSPSENEVMVKYGIDLIPSLTDFLREAMIAYDYRDNLLWILNPNHELCYILSIDSGAYALTTIPYKPIGTVNDYPDTIIETQYNQTFKTYSLINRQNINDDERRIDGFIFSRPMKLGDSLALKTPIDIRLIENLNKNAGIRIRLFVSDDLRNWTRTNSYRGRGYKYFKYNLIFEKMLPTDTISGIVSRWQFRYGNKLR